MVVPAFSPAPRKYPGKMAINAGVQPTGYRAALRICGQLVLVGPDIRRQFLASYTAIQPVFAMFVAEGLR
jgi:hypothetical protein